jgi:hypothetical protein
MARAIFGIAWMFRVEIKAALATVPSLAGRVSKIGGLFELQQQQATTDAIAELRGVELHAVAGEVTVAAPALPPAPDLEPFEVRVREVMQTVAPANRQHELVRAVAGLLRDLTLYQIFGTQLGALRTLSVSGPLPEAALNNLHQEHATRATATSLAPFSFIAWMAFLLQRGLVVQDQQGRYVVTDAGRATLQAAVNAGGVPEARAF